MPEVEAKPITEPETLLPIRGHGGSMIERWIETDPDIAVKRMSAMVKMIDELRTASIRATYPSDWIVNVSRDKDGNVISQRGYLQDIGAERAGKLWGIEVGAPAIEDKTFPDGTCATYMIAEAWSKVTGERLDYVEGSRWSGDRFFARSVGPDEKVDPTDVRKAAYANLHGRAVRALSGLNGVPLEILKGAGIDVSKVVTVDYEKGGKGGESTGASVGVSEAPVIPWGNAKGQKVTDLAVKDLAYYLGAYEKDVADPAKAKFQKANERMLSALKAEQERRARSAEQVASEAPASSDGAKAETATGDNIRGDVWTRLVDAAGKQAMPALRALVKELCGTERTGLSDCTEEELRKLATIPEETLKATAQSMAKAKS